MKNLFLVPFKPFFALFFFCVASSALFFVMDGETVSTENQALFLWTLVFLSTLVSFEHFSLGLSRESLDQIFLSPLNAWRILLRFFCQHVVCHHIPLVGLLNVLCVLYTLPGEFVQGLTWAYILTAPVLSCLGVLMSLLRIGEQGYPLITASLLFPFGLPSFILGWGFVEAFVHAYPVWPCICGLTGLWCVQGCVTLFSGTWILKQQALQ